MRLLMAKKVAGLQSIKKPQDLVTSRENTRAGFIAMALEKGSMAVPYIEEAKALKALSAKAKHPKDLLKLSGVQVGLLTASGLSDKSLKFLTEADKVIAIKGLIEKFLEPAGADFINELVYRYLLTKGDALGGKARNLAGSLGEWKFLRAFLSVLSLAGIEYHWNDNETKAWMVKPKNDSGIEKRLSSLYWNHGKGNRILTLNRKVPLVNKNVDLCLLDGIPEELLAGKNSIIHDPARYIALGELKGGIDPAGADEHWKTANSALNRIRSSFGKRKLNPNSFFVGAAIEGDMAMEIFNDLEKGIINNAANLTNDNQLASICDWIIKL